MLPGAILWPDLTLPTMGTIARTTERRIGLTWLSFSPCASSHTERPVTGTLPADLRAGAAGYWRETFQPGRGFAACGDSVAGAAGDHSLTFSPFTCDDRKRGFCLPVTGRAPVLARCRACRARGSGGRPWRACMPVVLACRLLVTVLPTCSQRRIRSLIVRLLSYGVLRPYDDA